MQTIEYVSIIAILLATFFLSGELIGYKVTAAILIVTLIVIWLAAYVFYVSIEGTL